MLASKALEGNFCQRWPTSKKSMMHACPPQAARMLQCMVLPKAYALKPAINRKPQSHKLVGVRVTELVELVRFYNTS